MCIMYLPSIFFSNNHSAVGGGVLLYVRETFNPNKLVNLSIMYEQSETFFAQFSAGDVG